MQIEIYRSKSDMTRFRVLAWLAALVVLAGCERSSSGYQFVESAPVTISGGEGQPDIEVTRSCGPRAIVGYTEHEGGTFRIIEDSTARAPVWVSSDKKEIVTYSFSIETNKSCYVDIRFENKISVSQIPLSEWAFSSEEKQAFDQGMLRCEAMGQFATRLYSRTILDSVSNLVVVSPTTGGPPIISGDFYGCPYIVANNTIGMYVKNDDATWRVFVSFENLVISRIK